ncbi:hypothetical protein HAX54_008081, partial [Datura stramonium]|nr:hypothetical protein [Datura stramonium]
MKNDRKSTARLLGTLYITERKAEPNIMASTGVEKLDWVALKLEETPEGHSAAKVRSLTWKGDGEINRSAAAPTTLATWVTSKRSKQITLIVEGTWRSMCNVLPRQLDHSNCVVWKICHCPGPGSHSPHLAGLRHHDMPLRALLNAMSGLEAQ